MKTRIKHLKFLQLLVFLIVLIGTTSCNKGFNTPSRAKKTAFNTASTGKDETTRKGYYSNPFKGGTRAALKKYKKKKQRKLFKRIKVKSPKGPKSNFNMKRTVKKSRLKSSGSNYKRSRNSGGQRKNKNLFNTRKK